MTLVILGICVVLVLLSAPAERAPQKVRNRTKD